VQISPEGDWNNRKQISREVLFVSMGSALQSKCILFILSSIKVGRVNSKVIGCAKPIRKVIRVKLTRIRLYDSPYPQAQAEHKTNESLKWLSFFLSLCVCV